MLHLARDADDRPLAVGDGRPAQHAHELFRELLADSASSFVEATFTPREIAFARTASSRDPALHLAARFAAKEAAIKALDAASKDADVEPSPVPLRDVEVCRDARGRPSLAFGGAACLLAERIGVDRAWLSLSHDGDGAVAVVCLERMG